MDEPTDIGTLPEQLTRHDLGSVAFAGGAGALFERHLRFDAVVAYEAVGLRDTGDVYAGVCPGIGRSRMGSMSTSMTLYG